MCACACVSFLAMFVESHWKLPGWQDRDSLKKLLEEEAERERFAEESHGDRWSDIRWGHQGIDIWQLWQLWQLWQVWQVWQVAVGSNVSLMVSAGRSSGIEWRSGEGSISTIFHTAQNLRCSVLCQRCRTASEV